jgi:hypothetical protein
MPPEPVIVMHPPGLAGVLLACGLVWVLPVAHILLSRMFKNRPAGLGLLLVAAWVYLGVLLWGWVLLPAAGPADAVAALALAGFLFLVYAEAYSMLCRGFSLRLVVDVHLRRAMTFDELLAGYADGRGASWLMEKRIQGLGQIGLIHLDAEALSIRTARGRWAARLGAWMKRMLRMGSGG